MKDDLVDGWAAYQMNGDLSDCSADLFEAEISDEEFTSKGLPEDSSYSILVPVASPAFSDGSPAFADGSIEDSSLRHSLEDTNEEFSSRTMAHAAAATGLQEHNYQYFRHYHLHIYAAPILSSSRQLHIIQDYSLVAGAIVPKPDRFAVVVVMNVQFRDQRRLVTSCNLCSSSSKLGHFFASDWTHSWAEEFTTDTIAPCGHAYPVISMLLNHFDVYIDTFDPTLARKVNDRLSDLLVDISLVMLPGSWLNLIGFTYESRRGPLAVYFSACFTIVLIAKSYSSSGKKYLHCFQCPRRNGCSHTQNIAMRDEALNDFPDRQEPVDGENNVQETVVLISKQNYPCKSEYQTNN